MDRPHSGHHHLAPRLAAADEEPAVVLGGPGHDIPHRLPELDEAVGAGVNRCLRRGPPPVLGRHPREEPRVVQPSRLERCRKAAARLVDADGEQARSGDRAVLGEGLGCPVAQLVEVGGGFVAPASEPVAEQLVGEALDADAGRLADSAAPVALVDQDRCDRAGLHGEAGVQRLVRGDDHVGVGDLSPVALLQAAVKEAAAPVAGGANGLVHLEPRVDRRLHGRDVATHRRAGSRIDCLVAAQHRDGRPRRASLRSRPSSRASAAVRSSRKSARTLAAVWPCQAASPSSSDNVSARLVPSTAVASSDRNDPPVLRRSRITRAAILAARWRSTTPANAPRVPWPGSNPGRRRIRSASSLGAGRRGRRSRGPGAAEPASRQPRPLRELY